LNYTESINIFLGHKNLIYDIDILIDNFILIIKNLNKVLIKFILKENIK